jgi:hypothetical protein
MVWNYIIGARSAWIRDLRTESAEFDWIGGLISAMRLTALIGSAWLLAACTGSGYAVRPVPRIAADTVGKPVSLLEEAFGEPRKVDTTPTKLVYVWFLPQKPDGAPVGFHGCELEVTVEPESQQILGYSLENLGWAKCAEIRRRIRLVAG